MAHHWADPVEFGVLREAAALQVAASLPLNCFQGARWVRAIARSRRRPHEFVAVRAHSTHVDAHLFGSLHRRMGARVFESMPMMGYGGWVCARPLSVKQECELTESWLSHCPWPLVEITSAPGRVDSLPAAGGSLVRWMPLRRLAPLDTETHVLDLAGDDAALLARTRPAVRSYLRRVDEHGFMFQRGGRELLNEFYRWYRQGSESWRVASAHTYPLEFFEALCDGVGMDIWLVSKDGSGVGASAFLVGARDVLYLASGVERAKGPISAMDAMIWHAALHYRDRGFAILNLGASEGLDSVRRFKEKFGAVAMTCRRATFCLPRLHAMLRPRRHPT